VKDTFNLISDQIRALVHAVCELKELEETALVAEHGLGRHFGSSFKGAVALDWSDAAARRALVGRLVADARVALALGRAALRGFAKDTGCGGGREGASGPQTQGLLLGRGLRDRHTPWRRALPGRQAVGAPGSVRGRSATRGLRLLARRLRRLPAARALHDQPQRALRELLRRDPQAGAMASALQE
jgi:hypothetical protein